MQLLDVAICGLVEHALYFSHWLIGECTNVFFQIEGILGENNINKVKLSQLVCDYYDVKASGNVGFDQVSSAGGRWSLFRFAFIVLFPISFFYITENNAWKDSSSSRSRESYSRVTFFPAARC